MCILFAATYPERTRALILYGSYAHFHSAVLTPAQVDAFVADAEESWGTGRSLKSFAPNLVSDERFRAWWARFERLGTSPAGAIALRADERADRCAWRTDGDPGPDARDPPPGTMPE